jgi:hypothetical protein
MACPFFLKHGIEPVRKVIVGRHAEPLKQAAADFGWEEWSAFIERPPPAQWPPAVSASQSASPAAAN